MQRTLQTNFPSLIPWRGNCHAFPTNRPLVMMGEGDQIIPFWGEADMYF